MFTKETCQSPTSRWSNYLTFWPAANNVTSIMITLIPELNDADVLSVAHGWDRQIIVELYTEVEVLTSSKIGRLYSRRNSGYRKTDEWKNRKFKEQLEDFLKNRKFRIFITITGFYKEVRHIICILYYIKLCSLYWFSTLCRNLFSH